MNFKIFKVQVMGQHWLSETPAQVDVSGLTRALPDLIVEGEIRYLTEGN